MHQLCASVLQMKEPDPRFQSFAEQACAIELTILLKNALRLAGMDDVHT